MSVVYKSLTNFSTNEAVTLGPSRNVVHQLLTQHLDIWTAAEAEKKSGAGRSAGNRQAVYGVKKLRELILELAVRGKLVRQNPSDEPASELLKKIRAAESKLDANGSFAKGEKEKKPITDDEKPYELPVGWEWVRFGDIARHNSGKTLDKGRNTGKLRPYITTSNLYWGRFDFTNVRQMPIQDDELAKCTAQKGDLLICEGGEAGRAAVWDYDEEICFQNHIHRARFFSDIDVYFGYRVFEKLNSTGEIDQYRKGVGISNMSSKALASILFPLPPAQEQRRIAVKVDELMALCDQLEARHINAAEAHEKLVNHLLGTLTNSQDAEDFAVRWQRIAAHFDTLFTTETSIDALQQTLLQLAVMGKLVLQNQNDEPTSELCKHIQHERSKLISDKKIRKGQPLRLVTDQEKTFSIPQNWEWVRLGEIGEWGAGATPLRSNFNYYGGTISWFKSGELTSDFIDTSEETITDLALKECSLRLNQPGDVLIAMYGATIGKTAIVKVASTTNQAVCACTPYSGIFNRYLLILLKAMKANFIGQGAGGAQPNISREKIVATAVAFPPTAEQHRIVAKVDELMALCDRLKSRIADGIRQQQKLADVLVEQAVA